MVQFRAKSHVTWMGDAFGRCSYKDPGIGWGLWCLDWKLTFSLCHSSPSTYGPAISYDLGGGREREVVSKRLFLTFSSLVPVPHLRLLAALEGAILNGGECQSPRALQL